MNGPIARNVLHEAIHGDVSFVPEIEHDLQRCANPSVAGAYAKYASSFNESGLGTPGEERRRAHLQRESAFRRWFWALMAIALVLGVVLVGANVIRPSSAAPVKSDDYNYRQRATSLAVGKSIYLTDPYERCLVGLHKDATGQIIVATYC